MEMDGEFARNSRTDPDAGVAENRAVRAVIWRDPGPMASLNLLYGAGGKGHTPNPRGTFTFLREDPQATSPKFDVVDAQGVEWKVKLWRGNPVGNLGGALSLGRGLLR